MSMVDYLTNQHHFSRESALKAAPSLPPLKNPGKLDTVISFLRENGFSKSHFEEILKREPTALCCRLDTTIKPKLKFFQDQGLSQSEVADLIAANPWILLRSLDDKLAPSFFLLKKVLGSNDLVTKALGVSAWFLNKDLEKTMIPNIQYLQSCGISHSRIMSYVFSFPRFFMIDPKRMKELVQRCDELGFNKESGLYFQAIRTLSSMNSETWEKKLKLFKSLGFSDEQIVSTFRKCPHVFSVSETKIKKVAKALLSRKGMDASFIVDHPAVLIFSLEGRLLPRLEVYEILTRKKLVKRKLQFTTLFRYSSEMFRSRFVLPYMSELGKVSEAFKSHS